MVRTSVIMVFGVLMITENRTYHILCCHIKFLIITTTATFCISVSRQGTKVNVLNNTSSAQPVDSHKKVYHRFRLRFCHAVVLISNVRTSASKKLNWMALI